MQDRLGINSWRFSMGRAKLVFKVRQRGFPYPSSVAGCFWPQNEDMGCIPQGNTSLGPAMLRLCGAFERGGFAVTKLATFSTFSAALRSFNAPKIGVLQEFPKC